MTGTNMTDTIDIEGILLRHAQVTGFDKWTQFREIMNEYHSLQKQVNTLTNELDRYKSYVDRTNYDSEQVAIKSMYKDIEIGKLQEQVNKLTKALKDAQVEIALWNDPANSIEVIKVIIDEALQSIKESPREEQTP